MTARTKVRRSLNSAAAGVTVAALTGILAGIVLWCCYTLIPTKSTSPDADLGRSLLWIVSFGALFGTVSGTPSGVLVMCLSRANAAPWRSLPTLLIGTTAGLVLFGLPIALLPGSTITSILGPAMFLIGPTIGGVLATRFLPERNDTAAAPLPVRFVSGFLVGLIVGDGLLFDVIGPWLSKTLFAGFSWNVANPHLVYALCLAFYTVMGLVALTAAISEITGTKRTFWTGLTIGLASSLFVAGAFFLLTLASA